MKLAMGALLLTFITAITAGFFVYQFMFNLTDKMKAAFPTQSLQLGSVGINSTCITASVRNFASVNVQIVEAYVDDVRYGLEESIVVSPSGVGTVNLYGAYVEGETYTVRIIPSLGSPLVFDVKND
ncbi:hypothetical protein KAU93_05275 [Candidatus Bathyarchaeota archaeon]|nr:hypothetical protein [Candidatus Bathyarchaeota archaeon]